MSNDFINLIEKLEELEPQKNFIYLKNLMTGDVPDLPKHKRKFSNSDSYYGKPTEGVRINEGNISVEGYRCKKCGTLQWTGVWRKLRKERCIDCEGLLEFDSDKEFLEDWNFHWKFKPIEKYMKEKISPILKEYFKI
jgi:hypothetical protein